MISNTRQNWTTGQTVKVGFLSLTVVQAIPTPGDRGPDAYILSNAAKTQLYRFVPHNGLEKLSLIDAREMIAVAKVHADRQGAAAIQRAKQAAANISAINDLIFAV